MNCPSRTEEPEDTGMNQNPNALAADTTTREDLNGIANSRVLRRIASQEVEAPRIEGTDDVERMKGGNALKKILTNKMQGHVGGCDRRTDDVHQGDACSGGENNRNAVGKEFRRLCKVVMTFGKFVGPGFMVSDFSAIRIKILTT